MKVLIISQRINVILFFVRKYNTSNAFKCIAFILVPRSQYYYKYITSFSYKIADQNNNIADVYKTLYTITCCV